MLHERIYLDASDTRVYIDTYVANDTSHARPAMLVIPGGGYRQVCTDREGEPIAIAFMAKGYNAFVLNYRVDGETYPAQLIDASRAIVHIRDNAEKYSVDKEKVYAVGFSAGGHLAGSLAIMHDEPEVLKTLGARKGYNRPDAAILAYPVVSAVKQTHLGSFETLLGKNVSSFSEQEREYLSLECRASSDSAPLFIWHTAEDQIVPINGSMALAERYVELGLKTTLRLYPYGRHGVALSNDITVRDDPYAAQPLAEGWIDESCAWLKTL
ncbi:MAG: alpha/beta hydrolase [Clostridia bacterium]|nr:alpha/beta hydrolase [Clostridia bacterium]